jgi:two-component system NtrC family response regulator
MSEALNLAGRVAGTKVSILLNGESGTGKEVMARAIHLASLRKEKPFVAFNVGALSPNLIESELFGHEKGAFTGADKQRIGRFEAANGGTIFIDEIGDIPLEIQTKFLRVLQENQIERLGGNRQIDVDIRVIAATNKDLEAKIRTGEFREDLFYRLNVVTISLPPLRERKDDIPQLSDFFINKYANVNDKKVKGLSREAFDLVMKYDFPGNVRELENMMERAVILCRGDQITLDDLPNTIFQQSAAPLDESAAGLEQQVEALEKRLLHAALLRCGGNQSKAARQLEITERKLRYKLQKYGLDSK